jgi:hypothetical protein
MVLMNFLTTTLRSHNIHLNDTTGAHSIKIWSKFTHFFKKQGYFLFSRGNSIQLWKSFVYKREQVNRNSSISASSAELCRASSIIIPLYVFDPR